MGEVYCLFLKGTKANSYPVMAGAVGEGTPTSFFILKIPSSLSFASIYICLQSSNSEKSESHIWYLVFLTKRQVDTYDLQAQL